MCFSKTEVERGIILRSCLAEPLGARTRDSSLQRYVHFGALQPRENQWDCMNRRDDCSSKICCQYSSKILVRAYQIFVSHNASLVRLGNQPTPPILWANSVSSVLFCILRPRPSSVLGRGRPQVQAQQRSICPSE